MVVVIVVLSLLCGDCCVVIVVWWLLCCHCCVVIVVRSWWLLCCHCCVVYQRISWPDHFSRSRYDVKSFPYLQEADISSWHGMRWHVWAEIENEINAGKWQDIILLYYWENNGHAMWGYFSFKWKIWVQGVHLMQVGPRLLTMATTGPLHIKRQARWKNCHENSALRWASRQWHADVTSTVRLGRGGDMFVMRGVNIADNADSSTSYLNTINSLCYAQISMLPLCRDAHHSGPQREPGVVWLSWDRTTCSHGSRTEKWWCPPILAARSLQRMRREWANRVRAIRCNRQRFMKLC